MTTITPEFTFYGALSILAFMGILGIIIGRMRGGVPTQIAYYLMFFSIGAISFPIIRDFVKAVLKGFITAVGGGG